MFSTWATASAWWVALLEALPSREISPCSCLSRTSCAWLSCCCSPSSPYTCILNQPIHEPSLSFFLSHQLVLQTFHTALGLKVWVEDGRHGGPTICQCRLIHASHPILSHDGNFHLSYWTCLTFPSSDSEECSLWQVVLKAYLLGIHGQAFYLYWGPGAHQEHFSMDL